MRICIFILLSAVINHCLCFELFTAAVVGVTSVVSRYTYCKLKECCTENEIPADFRSKFYIFVNLKYIIYYFLRIRKLIKRKTVWPAFGTRCSSKCHKSPLDR